MAWDYYSGKAMRSDDYVRGGSLLRLAAAALAFRVETLVRIRCRFVRLGEVRIQRRERGSLVAGAEGIEQFLVATSVNLIQAQRLIRRVCKDCKVENPTPVEALMEVGFSAEDAKATKTYKGKGCTTCNNTGYKGRVGLYEVMEVNDDIRELILIGASSLELRKKAIEDGMITLRESGLHKIRAGITTLEEVVRETVA